MVPCSSFLLVLPTIQPTYIVQLWYGATFCPSACKRFMVTLPKPSRIQVRGHPPKPLCIQVWGSLTKPFCIQVRGNPPKTIRLQACVQERSAYNFTVRLSEAFCIVCSDCYLFTSFFFLSSSKTGLWYFSQTFAFTLQSWIQIHIAH